MEQGIDVGIESIGEKLKFDEYFYPDQEEYVSSGYLSGISFALQVKEGTKTVTYGVKDKERYIDAFHYKNQEGQRFLVYAFDASSVSEDRYRSYCMQRQLTDSIQWLGQKMLPAKCMGNPDLYILCKKSEHGMAVGLWNFFADDIPRPVVELAEVYEGAEFINCQGELKGRILTLEPIAPYGCAFVRLW